LFLFEFVSLKLDILVEMQSAASINEQMNTNPVMTFENVDDDLEEASFEAKRNKEDEKMATSKHVKPADLKVPPSRSSSLDSLEQMQQLKASAKAPPATIQNLMDKIQQKKEEAVLTTPVVVVPGGIMEEKLQMSTRLGRRLLRSNRSSSSTTETSTRIPGFSDDNATSPNEITQLRRKPSSSSTPTLLPTPSLLPTPTLLPGATRISGVSDELTAPAENSHNNVEESSPFVAEGRLVEEEEGGVSDKNRERIAAEIREGILGEMGQVTQGKVVTHHREDRKRYIAAGGCLFVLVLVLAIVLGVALGGGQNKDVPSARSSASPTGSPSHAPSINRLDYIRNLLNLTSVLGVDQNRALEWLAEIDPAILQLNTPDVIFRNRYALVVLYYSTNGDKWNDNTGWLSSLSVCAWNGVSCSSTDIVDYLELCKCRRTQRCAAYLFSLTCKPYTHRSMNDLATR
jgi:hypothetical protein